jgi:hypothetical protein
MRGDFMLGVPMILVCTSVWATSPDEKTALRHSARRVVAP